MDKAIKAYANRGTNLRHGIALDKQITIFSAKRRTPGLCAGSISISLRLIKKTGAEKGENQLIGAGLFVVHLQFA